MTEIKITNPTSFVSALDYITTKPKDEKVIISIVENISLFGVNWSFGDKEIHNVEIEGNGNFIQNLTISGDYSSLFGKLFNCKIRSLRLKSFNVTGRKMAATLATTAYMCEISNIELSDSLVIGDIASGIVATAEETKLNVIRLANTVTIGGEYCAGGVVGVAFKNTKILNVQSDVNLEAQNRDTYVAGITAIAIAVAGPVTITACVSDARWPLGLSNADAVLAKRLPYLRS